MNAILVVEQEPVLRNLLEKQLAGRYEIFRAGSAAEAIYVFRAHRGIEVLIADSNMGLVSGMELASLLRAWIPGLKAVLMSDLPGDLWTDRQIAELNELPADIAIVLRKPFPPRALEAALAELTGAGTSVGV